MLVEFVLPAAQGAGKLSTSIIQGTGCISPCEVTNSEFREFLSDFRGYADDANWNE